MTPRPQVAFEEASPPEDPRRASPGGRRGRGGTFGLLSPPLVFLTVFFVVPVGILAAYSVGAFTLFPGPQHVTLSAWKRLLSGDSIHLALFWKSVRMSLVVSIVVVVLAYPIAYFLALAATKRKYVLLLLIIAPFLTSYLLRVFAWKVILGDQGVINSFFFWSGLREPGHPISQLLYSQFSVMLVLAYVWLPFVALPIFVSLDSLDRSLLEAASDLGATRWKTFWKVTFRLSLPGVLAGFVFVFIPTIGDFVTPLLVGGVNGFMYGNAIADLFGPSFDWQTGSVLALFLLAVVAALIGVFGRSLQVRRVTRG